MDAVALQTPEALRELTVADSPFPGTLRAGDPPTLWVDAALFGESPAWAAADADHLLTAIDAAGTPDGAQVILPHCPVRLAELLRGGGVGSRGVIVTVAVSALRGAAQADTHHAACGQWWVTTSGRPVLALTGALDWRADTVELLEGLAEEEADAMGEVLRRAAATVADARLLRREGEAVEAELFALAAATPLSLEPVRAAGRDPARRSSASPPPAVAGVWPVLHEGIGRFVDRAIADRFGGVAASLGAGWSRTRRIRRQDGSSRPRRRRVGLVAVGAAAAVLMGGVLWPAAGGDPAASSRIVGAEPSPGRPTGVATRQPSIPAVAPTAGDPGDPLTSGRAVIAAAARCATPDCVAALWESPARAQEIVAAAGAHEVELVDEYGGVAALRVTGGDTSQIVVLVQAEQRWLVREVYDLADQP